MSSDPKGNENASAKKSDKKLVQSNLFKNKAVLVSPTPIKNNENIDYQNVVNKFCQMPQNLFVSSKAELMNNANTYWKAVKSDKNAITKFLEAPIQDYNPSKVDIWLKQANDTKKEQNTNLKRKLSDISQQSQTSQHSNIKKVKVSKVIDYESILNFIFGQSDNQEENNQDRYREIVKNKLLVEEKVNSDFLYALTNYCHELRDYEKFSKFKISKSKVQQYIKDMSKLISNLKSYFIQLIDNENDVQTIRNQSQDYGIMDFLISDAEIKRKITDLEIKQGILKLEILKIIGCVTAKMASSHS